MKQLEEWELGERRYKGRMSNHKRGQTINSQKKSVVLRRMLKDVGKKG